MARFRGHIQGARGPTSRLGHRTLSVEAQSWAGKVVVDMWRDASDAECVEIRLAPHKGRGEACLIYTGKLVDVPAWASYVADCVTMRDGLRRTRKGG